MGTEKKRQFNVALIGVGNMGKNHLRVISESKDFILKAVVDVNSEKLRGNVPAGVALLHSLEDLNKIEFDCAVIATPTQTHLEIGKQLIGMGKNILMEKPLASNPDQCLSLIELSKNAGVLLCVGHVERFNPAVRKLRQVIQEGWLGQPIHFNVTRVGGYPNEVKEGNNVLLDLAVHDLDVIASMVGPMKILASTCHSTWKKDIFDTAEILLTAKTGSSASLHVNWITPTKIRTIRVTGTRGVCFVDYILQTCTLYGGNLLKNRSVTTLDFEQQVESYRNTDKIEFGVQKEEPLKAQLKHFAQALRGEESEICLASDAVDAVRLAHEAVMKSEKQISLSRES